MSQTIRAFYLSNKRLLNDQVATEGFRAPRRVDRANSRIGAGHMIPEDKPEVALRLFERFLTNQDLSENNMHLHYIEIHIKRVIAINMLSIGRKLKAKIPNHRLCLWFPPGSRRLGNQKWKEREKQILRTLRFCLLWLDLDVVNWKWAGHIGRMEDGRLEHNGNQENERDQQEDQNSAVAMISWKKKELHGQGKQRADSVGGQFRKATSCSGGMQPGIT
ncbi:hypothetical protein GQR58_023506 [Nymphon striatum]|nr:hypothetical protein GQR58_023506 [Nymphon striatum]